MSDNLTGDLTRIAKGLWWLVLLRGILAIIFGILAVWAPFAALAGIVIVLGIYLLMAGIAEIVHAVRIRTTDRRWGWLLFQGIVSVLGGLAALFVPGLAGLVGGLFILWMIVVYAAIHGVSTLASAAGVGSGGARGWAIFSGIVSILLAIVLAIFTILTPGSTVLSLIWVVGIYAILFGIILIVAAIRARR